MNPIVLHEVGPRDGLQMERRVVPTATKLDWIAAIADSGLDLVQVGSFVRPDRVPTMADSDTLFACLRAPERPEPKARLSALVLNQKGLLRAIDARVDLLCMGVSASETHSRKNTGMSIARATQEVLAMARHAAQEGLEVQISVQSAFGCGYEGAVPQQRVLDLVHSFLDAGHRSISLADTAGHATPEAVESLFGAVFRAGAEPECACHFHDTYGLALANCVAALRAGVTRFETSVAGLGGCPFTAVAGGNTCTEDFVHYLHLRGLRQDVRLDPILAVARDVASFFGREMPGSVYRTGPIRQPVAVS